MRGLREIITGVLFLMPLLLGADEAPPRVVDPEADRIMKRTCEQLRSAPAFSVSVDISDDDVLESGLTMQYQRASDLVLDRPNHLRIEGDSDKGRRTILYDGKTVTVFNRDENVYAQAAAPDTVDATLDKLKELGVSLPLEDLMSGDPCAWLYEDVWDSYYAGRHYLEGRFVHHLLFRVKAADFQIWVQGDEVPVLRKVLIEYREKEGKPRYEARLFDWDFRPTIDAEDFTFTPPQGASRIEFRTENNIGEGEGDMP